MDENPVKPPRSEEGVWGRRPQAGFRAAALTYPVRRAQEAARISEEPKAASEIPVWIESISAVIAEILSRLYRNRHCRLSALLRFLFFLFDGVTLGCRPNLRGDFFLLARRSSVRAALTVHWTVIHSCPSSAEPNPQTPSLLRAGLKWIDQALAFFHIILYNILRPICAGWAQRYFHAHRRKLYGGNRYETDCCNCSG